MSQNSQSRPVRVQVVIPFHQSIVASDDDLGRAWDEAYAPLLQRIDQSGAKVAVRQVAKELRIGSSKATKLLQQATEIGVLHKTPGGYVAA